MENNRPMNQGATSIDLAPAAKHPGRNELAAQVTAQQPQRTLSERLRARAEMVRHALDCGAP